MSKYLLLFAGLVLISVPTVYAEVTLGKSSKIKAAYLFNFTKYIEWPAEAFSGNQQSIHICLDGASPMLDFMQTLVAQRKVGKSRRLVKILAFNESDICHLSYLDSELTPLPEYIANSLVVTDEAFLTSVPPTMVFYQNNGKLRFEIYMQEVQTRHLTVSSELLKLARVK